MLRSRLSSSSLRSLSKSHLSIATAPRVPSIPVQYLSTSTKSTPSAPEGSRGLASAVLLSGRGGENWAGRTVKGLKDALISRGLSRVGDKKTLIARLESFESKRADASTSARVPAPSTIKTTTLKPKQPATSSKTSTPTLTRAISSTATLKASKSSSSSKNTSTTKAHTTPDNLTANSTNVKQDSEIPPPLTHPSDDDHDTTLPTSTAVHLPTGPSPTPTAEVTEQMSSAVAPGVPEKAAKESGVFDIKDEAVEKMGGLSVEMPTYEEGKTELAEAPFTPDNFLSPETSSETKSETSTTPKVSTISGDSSGSETVRHALHDTVDNMTSDAHESASSSSAGSSSMVGAAAGVVAGAKDKLASAASGAQDVVSGMKEKLGSVASGAMEAASGAKDKLENVASEVYEAASGSGSAATEKFKDLIPNNASEAVSQAKDKVKHTAQDVGLDGLDVALGAMKLPRVGGVLKGFKMPEGKPSGEFKPIERGLNGEEKTGGYILAGLVAVGLLLGGGRSSSKSKDEGHGHEHGSGHGSSGSSGKSASGKAKGDAEWEKASGAGIVGHGARKA